MPLCQMEKNWNFFHTIAWLTVNKNKASQRGDYHKVVFLSKNSTLNTLLCKQVRMQVFILLPLMQMKNRTSIVQSRYFAMSRNIFNDYALQIRWLDFFVCVKTNLPYSLN